jgi:hypothetical protein
MINTLSTYKKPPETPIFALLGLLVTGVQPCFSVQIYTVVFKLVIILINALVIAKRFHVPHRFSFLVD